ncbi:MULTISPECIES: hypothetical protein [Vreelandella]|uniref:Uncharacterized protein n=2 Tax=Vreelandella TaxID=3137766 RepID=A0A7C9NN44_9GAMM|nr:MULTISPECIES: hypothetical protein [Halomonas]NDL70649.1 hypothetical protein [Halomonas alkaliphila]NYS44746.1 hypothetical protein [Halomonas zhaodongensis]
MYKVLAATRADMNEGWVWLSQHDFAPRSIVKIRSKVNNKVVYCEALEMDENFIKDYNKSPRVSISQNGHTIVMNGWYRNRLGGIETNQNHGLEVSGSNGPWGKFRASTGHPQVVVRLATWLAVISVGLGILGVCLALK